MIRVYGVKYGHGGAMVECVCDDIGPKVGSMVVLQTDEGTSLGQVIYRMDRSEDSAQGRLVRLADEADLARHDENNHLERQAFTFCTERVSARKMDMRLVAVERLFDGAKMIFYFTAEGRVDFRALVKDLAGRFRCRVEMRQIGVRNETKILGGVGSCGRQLCCNTFMQSFSPVSVKMAKEQNLSLNPNKISGICGRLMCCLSYEFPVYMECKKGMPKLGKRVESPEGIGKVIRQNVMAGRVTVYVEGREHEFSSDELQPAPPPPQQKKKKKPGRKSSR